MNKIKSTLSYIVLATLLLITGLPLHAQQAQKQDTTVSTKKVAVVYVTNTGTKYHASGCRYLSKSKIEMNLSRAKENGYEACKVCGGTASYKEQGSNSRNEYQRRATSVQCSGTTQAGNRCKRMTTGASGRCWQH